MNRPLKCFTDFSWILFHCVVWYCECWCCFSFITRGKKKQREKRKCIYYKNLRLLYELSSEMFHRFFVISFQLCGLILSMFIQSYISKKIFKWLSSTFLVKVQYYKVACKDFTVQIFIIALLFWGNFYD